MAADQIAKAELRARVISFYLPQYHSIPQNDEWWGKGFTDWNNVRESLPLFPGHLQPRVPLKDNYYDLSDPNTIRWQVDLAKKYGIHGFCHYHYWFDGIQLLEKPTNMFLEDRTIDMPFCLAWANATWSRTWDGNENRDSVLIAQNHRPNPELWQKHFNYLWRAWSDPRAIRIDGKPVFLIYRPQIIVELPRLLEFWRKSARERGLPGLTILAMRQYRLIDESVFSYFDGIVDFQPAVAMFAPMQTDRILSRVNLERYLRDLPRPLQRVLKKIQGVLPHRPTYHDYDDLWSRIVGGFEGSAGRYPGAFLDWDNTPRYRRRARIVRDASPARFEMWFSKLVSLIQDRPIDERLVFLNAWNEWAEGTYLEPDVPNGYGYLEAVRRCVLPNKVVHE